MSDVRQFLASLDGITQRGGCDYCDADQTVRADADHPGLFHLEIRHDDGCPFLAAVRRGREEQRGEDPL